MSITITAPQAAAAPAITPLSPVQMGRMLTGLGLVTWMQFYTYDAVNLVLPDIAGTFGVTRDQASWILTVYLSALLLGVPIAIWLAGHVGHRRYIVWSAVGFAVASVGCSLAPDLGTMLFWRAVQGFAGSGLIMWWRATIYVLVQGPARSPLMMKVSRILYLGTGLGLLMSGYITDNYDWRLIFLPNLPAAAIGISILLRVYPTLPVPKSSRLVGRDAIGIALIGTTLICAQIVLSRGEIDDWFASPTIQALAWIGGAALVLFIAWQRSRSNPAPLLRLELMKDRNVIASIVLGLFAGVILSGSLYAMPEFLRTVDANHLSATQAGQIMCVYALAAAALRPLVTMGVTRFGQRKAIAFAFAVLVPSMLLAARLMTSGTPEIYYVAPIALYAFALAPMLTSIGMGTVSRLAKEEQLDAVAIYMTFRQFGASLGVTLVTIILDQRETLHSARLFEHLQATAPDVSAWLARTTETVVARSGQASMAARQVALKLLGEEGSRQAATLAYADAFYFMAMVGAVALCFVPLMTKPPVKK